MKYVFCFLMIGVLLFGMVSPVLAEEVSSPPESSVSDVPVEESLGSNPENSESSSSSDSGDSGGSDGDSSGSVTDGSESSGSDSPEATESTEPIESESGEEDYTFVSESGEVYIEADAVYLTGEDEAITYSVGDVLSGGAFFDVETSELGSVKIYIPIDYQEGSFAYDNHGNLVNIRAASITGYILDGTQYSVRWTSFNTPQYRLTNYDYGSSYEDLTITFVNDSNIQIVEDDSEVPLFPDERYISLGIFALLGVAVLCLFMKA